MLYGLPRAKSDMSSNTIGQYNDSLASLNGDLRFGVKSQLKALKYTMNQKFLNQVKEIQDAPEKQTYALPSIVLRHKDSRNYTIKGTVKKRDYSFKIETREKEKTFI